MQAATTTLVACVLFAEAHAIGLEPLLAASAPPDAAAAASSSSRVRVRGLDDAEPGLAPIGSLEEKRAAAGAFRVRTPRDADGVALALPHGPPAAAELWGSAARRDDAADSPRRQKGPLTSRVEAGLAAAAARAAAADNARHESQLSAGGRLAPPAPDEETEGLGLIHPGSRAYRRGAPSERGGLDSGGADAAKIKAAVAAEAAEAVADEPGG